MFSVCDPQYVIQPPVTENVPLHGKLLCKILHERLGGANNMLTLSGGGGHKNKRSDIFMLLMGCIGLLKFHGKNKRKIGSMFVPQAHGMY